MQNKGRFERVFFLATLWALLASKTCQKSFSRYLPARFIFAFKINLVFRYCFLMPQWTKEWTKNGPKLDQKSLIKNGLGTIIYEAKLAPKSDPNIFDVKTSSIHSSSPKDRSFKTFRATSVDQTFSMLRPRRRNTKALPQPADDKRRAGGGDPPWGVSIILAENPHRGLISFMAFYDGSDYACFCT